MNGAKWKIAVLYGGDSSERDVSLRTGEAVASALDARGHSVRLVDVRGRTLACMDGVECDAAFIALHGAFGEDGGVQALLEERGIAYTGSGVEASRLAMDKAASKERFVAAGIATPEYAVLDERSRCEEIRRSIVRMGFPQVVKPSREGSSVGVTVAWSVPETIQGLREAFALDSCVLIERWIRGRELTVTILGTRALPIIELIYPGRLFDREAKYTPGVTRHVVNPELGAGVAERVQEAGLAAHRALGCRDISRVDVMLGEDNVPYVLEVNTIPGMTETSLVPESARAAGIEFGELCERIVRHALIASGREAAGEERGGERWSSGDKR